MYQCVWIPKYQGEVFRELHGKVLKQIMEEIGCDDTIEIVEFEMLDDYQHMVVRSEPKISPFR